MFDYRDQSPKALLVHESMLADDIADFLKEISIDSLAESIEDIDSLYCHYWDEVNLQKITQGACTATWWSIRGEIWKVNSSNGYPMVWLRFVDCQHHHHGNTSNQKIWSLTLAQGDVLRWRLSNQEQFGQMATTGCTKTKQNSQSATSSLHNKILKKPRME